MKRTETTASPRNKPAKSYQRSQVGVSKPATSNAQGQTKAKVNEQQKQCPICLERITNISHCDPCMHYFCAACIDKWIQQKPACPQCRQTVHGIIFNIRSDSDYDELLLTPPATSQYSSVNAPTRLENAAAATSTSARRNTAPPNELLRNAKQVQLAWSPYGYANMNPSFAQSSLTSSSSSSRRPSEAQLSQMLAAYVSLSPRGPHPVSSYDFFGPRYSAR